MSYLCGGKVFAMEQEAVGYANLVARKCRIILGVEKTKRKPTHTFSLKKLENVKS